MQHGTITKVKYLAHEADTAGMRVGVFRPNGSAWDNVGWSEVFNTVAGSTQTRVLTTPIANVQPGDVLGYWIAGIEVTSGSIGACASGGDGIKWDAGLITGTAHTFGNTIGAVALPLEAFGISPWIAIAGDSLPSGHGGGSPWNEFFDVTNALSGDVSRELGFRLRAIRGTGFTYQAVCSGSKTMTDVDTNQIPAILAGTGMHESQGMQPLAILIHAMVNDAAAGTPWSTVQTHLNSIVSQCGTIPLFINNCAPASSLSDSAAALVRTYNTNLVTWAASKPTVTIIDVWSLLGAFRSSTGFNDNLAAINDIGDGIHWSLAGVTTVANADNAALAALFS
jgi:hypothetical protein